MHGYEKKLRYDTSHDMPLLFMVKQASRVSNSWVSIVTTDYISVSGTKKLKGFIIVFHWITNYLICFSFLKIQNAGIVLKIQKQKILILRSFSELVVHLNVELNTLYDP